MSRYKTIKAVLACILAIVVLAVQGLVTAAPEMATKVPRPACHCCGTMNCCVGQTGAQSTPTPATPARATQETQLQAALVLVSYLVAEPAPVNVRISSHVTSLSGVTASPLYQRDCSYLI